MRPELDNETAPELPPRSEQAVKSFRLFSKRQVASIPRLSLFSRASFNRRVSRTSTALEAFPAVEESEDLSTHTFRIDEDEAEQARDKYLQTKLGRQLIEMQSPLPVSPRQQSAQTSLVSNPEPSLVDNSSSKRLKKGMCISLSCLVVLAGVFVGMSLSNLVDVGLRPSFLSRGSESESSATSSPTENSTNGQPQRVFVPTFSPTRLGFESPTTTPTIPEVNTRSPTKSPSMEIVVESTPQPSSSPTRSPSFTPSKEPTYSPTVIPSNIPTKSPSLAPTNTPTSKPTKRDRGDSDKEEDEEDD
eukprot:snap_masked-scaffold_67-processed-gene-0.41-mRNA-1 protein AED:0.33 eAED:0.34 QI:0/-1/0/1/-1/1/1/0/302